MNICFPTIMLVPVPVPVPTTNLFHTSLVLLSHLSYQLRLPISLLLSHLDVLHVAHCQLSWRASSKS